MKEISATVQVFAFFVIILVILVAYKYYVYTYEEPALPSSQTLLTSNKEPVINRVRCPPKEFKMYQQDDNPLDHKNNLNNPNAQIKLYQEGDEVSSEGFHKAVITPNHQEFASELEDVYTQSVATPHMSNSTPHVKPNKSDLPIANVPYFLLQNDKPLRLSEKPA
jgi:hypothetical protein